RWVRGLAGSAESPRRPPPARFAHQRRDWRRDKALPETARRAVRVARFLRLRDSDRGLQRLLGRRGIGRVALQQDPGADAVHFRFVITLLGALQLGERAVQAL